MGEHADLCMAVRVCAHSKSSYVNACKCVSKGGRQLSKVRCWRGGAFILIIVLGNTFEVR